MAKQDIEQDEQQTTFLNLKTKEISPYWIDPNQPLLIPDNTLHWKAHKYQLLVEALQRQAEKNPAQFNSKNYIDAVEAYTNCLNEIKDGENDSRGVAKISSGQASGVGEGNTAGVDFGVSTDNPTAR